MIKLSTFTYQRRFIISFWRDTSVGNCQDYAWTTLKHNVGGTMNALIALFTFKAMILRARSPSNHWWWPRHAVLKYKGQWIDSTEREWRASPEPHKPLWPALPAPITIALVAALSWLLLTGQVFAQQGQCGERSSRSFPQQ